MKMVHNGIEYGDMQLISEAYDVLRTVGGLTNEEMVEAFNEWNAVRHPSASITIVKSPPILHTRQSGVPSGLHWFDQEYLYSLLLRAVSEKAFSVGLLHIGGCSDGGLTRAD